MAKKKVDLAKEAKTTSNDAEVEQKVSLEDLLEVCPKDMLKAFKAAKTPASKADFLYELDKGPLKEARDAYNKLDTFAKKIKQWFIQEFEDDQKGVTGKVGRVEIKMKTVPNVADWEKVYAHIAKKKEFELLNRAINAKAVGERWEQGKEIPGIEKFDRPSVSLTKVAK